MIDSDDQYDYAIGRIHKKTLQPKQKHIGMFDVENFMSDWNNNCINDRSFRCLDLAFFDDYEGELDNEDGVGDDMALGSGIVRHGIYVNSSKDWNKVKDSIIEETKLAR